MALDTEALEMTQDMDVSRTIFQHVARVRPDIYQRILHTIQPHSLDAVLRFFEKHLKHSVVDLHMLDAIDLPRLCLAFVQAIRRQFPSPGDAFGIQLTCRLTKSDTQVTLDSKHLRVALDSVSYNVDKDLKYELNLFTNHTQVFEMATTHTYASVFTKNYSVEQLMERIPNAGHLVRGDPFHKGRNRQGQLKYLSSFTYIIVPNRVLYKTFSELKILLNHLKADCIVGLSNIRYMFSKCGLASYFFNMIHVIQRQLVNDTDSVYAQDVTTVLKYQCHTGTPLPLTRDGLVRNPERSPIEILSFEAPKKNFARMCTTEYKMNPVKTSADKIFFGQQFNEGTGYKFAMLPNRV